MKLKSILVAFTMLFFVGASFAKASSKSISIAKVSKAKFISVKVKNSCTIHLKSSSRDVTVTSTCDCTEKQACDRAYAVATFFMS
jgi:hypothetical protein